MPTTLKFTNDAFPPDTEFGVEGIGVLKNGQAKELTEDEERAYAASTRSLIHESCKDSEMFEVSGTPTFTSIKDAIGIDPEEISFVTTEVTTPVDAVETNVPENQSEKLDLGGDS
jgi:hypothetical protein